MCTLHCLLQVDRKDCKWILRSWTLLLKQKQEAAKEQPHQDHLRKTFLEERNPNVNTNVNCNTNFNILRKNMKKYGEGRQEMKIKARLISSFFANWKHKALFKLGEKTTCENTRLNKLKSKQWWKLGVLEPWGTTAYGWTEIPPLSAKAPLLFLHFLYNCDMLHLPW